MGDVLGIGIIGLGRVSAFYVDAIRASRRFELCAVCDTDSEVLEPFRREGFRAHTESAAFLAEDAFDAVVIDTPVATHADLSAAALEAGKHVCCEKPLALTKDVAAGLVELAEARGRTMFTAFHRRYNRNLPAPGSVALDGVSEVEVAYLEQIEEHAGRGDWHISSAANGGGVIVDNGPNSFAVVRHLFGSVTATGAQVERSPEGVDVSAVVRGRLDGGTEVVLRLDWAYDGERKDVVVRHEGGAETRFDMLAGFAAFKSSLQHEYEALLDHFADLIEAGGRDSMGLDCSAWLEEVLTLAESPR